MAPASRPGPIPLGMARARRPIPQQIRVVAKTAGSTSVDPNLPVLAQPVLVVEFHRFWRALRRHWERTIWLPDGTVAGLVQRTALHVFRIVDAAGEVLAWMESPRDLREAQGARSLRDGSGRQVGVIEEFGLGYRELHLTDRTPENEGDSLAAVVRARRAETPPTAIMRGDHDGARVVAGDRVVAEISRHHVDPLNEGPSAHVLLVTLAPTEGPFRTLLFANAVTAFMPLQLRPGAAV